MLVCSHQELWAREVAQQIECLPCKHEDGDSDSRTPTKSQLSVVETTHSSRVWEEESPGDNWLLWVQKGPVSVKRVESCLLYCELQQGLVSQFMWAKPRAGDSEREGASANQEATPFNFSIMSQTGRNEVGGISIKGICLPLHIISTLAEGRESP